MPEVNQELKQAPDKIKGFFPEQPYNYIVKFILYIWTFLFLIGCEPISCPHAVNESPEQILMVGIDPPFTRSFNGIAAESWEKKINTATIYVLAPDGTVIRSQSLTAPQITAINNATNFVIPMIIPGNLTSCDVYMVANTTPSAAINTKASLLTSFEQDITSYNGTYDLVTSQALRPNGFVMTGKQEGVLLHASQTTNVNIALKRIVAKVAVDINFTTILNLGQLTLNNVTLTQSAPYSNLFPLTNGKTGGTAVTLSQTPKPNGTNKYRAFFYIYENDGRALSSAPTINLSGSGMLLLITTPFSYRIPLDGDLQNNIATGRITRNSVYYITINVTKLTNILL